MRIVIFFLGFLAVAVNALAEDPVMLFNPAAIEAKYGKLKMNELRGLYLPDGPHGLAIPRSHSVSERSASHQARVYRKWIEQRIGNNATSLKAVDRARQLELKQFVEKNPQFREALQGLLSLGSR